MKCWWWGASFCSVRHFLSSSFLFFLKFHSFLAALEPVNECNSYKQGNKKCIINRMHFKTSLWAKCIKLSGNSRRWTNRVRQNKGGQKEKGNFITSALSAEGGLQCFILMSVCVCVCVCVCVWNLYIRHDTRLTNRGEDDERKTNAAGNNINQDRWAAL